MTKCRRQPAKRRYEPPATRLPQPQAPAHPVDSHRAGVAVAVGSFITLYGLSRSVNENVQQAFEERGTDLTVRRRGIAPFGGTLPKSIIPDIAQVKHRRHRTGRPHTRTQRTLLPRC